MRQKARVCDFYAKNAAIGEFCPNTIAKRKRAIKLSQNRAKAAQDFSLMYCIDY